MNWKKTAIVRTAMQLWKDECGATSAMSAIFVTVLLAIGVLTGLVMVRDHVVQEFGDTAVGLNSLDQSFSYTVTVNGTVVSQAQYVDDPPTLTDPNNAEPACINFNDPRNAVTGENGSVIFVGGGFP